MERLTARDDKTNRPYYPYCFRDNTCDGKGASDKCNNCNFNEKIINKLAEYEDAEEQGLLLRLQCKVGDIVWDNDFGMPCRYEITGYSFGTAESYINKPIKEDDVVYYYANSSGSIDGSFVTSAVGKSVFLTKEEAEQALKQMGE